MTEIVHGSDRRAVEPELIVDHSFSAKPKPADRYRDFYEKLTEYVNRISGPAEALEPSVTARTFGVVEERDAGSVFRYTENASALAGIAALTPTLAVRKVAIIGTGGTGAYVLDLLAKTPVEEIHLYDGDEFLQHNAFRAPGAASLTQLRGRPSKVAYFLGMYDPMRRGIIPHPEYIDRRVSFGARDGEAGDEYEKNIQIAELNALNAVMAVIKWKKLCGFYVDLEREGHSAYIIEGNGLVSDDQGESQ
ncbi:MAG: hypothetical protein HEQ38_08675 [Gemmatimonas sp.]|nr:hypothetical protein [Gemmatimonas sp.]